MIIGLILLLVVDSSVVRKEACDMIEVHHMHDANGNPLFDQIIFWDWHSDENRYHVRAWKITQDERPVKHGNRWYISYPDQSIGRCFVSSICKESWLQRDPERDDKHEWPEFCRVALRK